MINACELCARVAVKEEAKYLLKVQIAKAFAEEVISPILEELSEIPDHLFIGYRADYAREVALYRKISDWRKGTTTRGNPMKDRYLTDGVKGSVDFSLLDYEILNQYLAEFGFQISYTTKRVCFAEYSTSTPNHEKAVDFLYISMTCPLENC